MPALVLVDEYEYPIIANIYIYIYIYIYLFKDIKRVKKIFYLAHM